MTAHTTTRSTEANRRGARRMLIAMALTALAATGMSVVSAAQAAPAVAATGILLEADGTPVANAGVRHRGAGGYGFRTDDQGRFTVPLNSDQAYALDFVYPIPDSKSTLTVHGSSMPPVTESVDLGAITMPPVVEHQIRAVDVDGAEVHRAFLSGATWLAGTEWEDQGADLTTSGDMVIDNAIFDSSEHSDPQGLVTFPGPRMTTRTIPLYIAHADLSVSRTSRTWNPDGTPSPDGVWTVSLDNFRIGPPLEPWSPILDYVDKNTIRVMPRAGTYDGGSVITGYDIEVTPAGGETTTTRMDASSPSTEVSGLTPGVEHAVRTRAINAAGTSVPGLYANHIVPAGPPSRIKRPTATVGTKPRTNHGFGNVIIKWKTPDDNGARLAWFYVSADGGRPVRVHHSRNRLRTKAKAGRHKYTITALNVRGISKPSKPVTVRVRPRR